MGSEDARNPDFPEPSAPGPMGPSTVLVVEDEEATREVLVDLVAALGYDARAVENGISAIEALERSSFALALVDLHLPDCSGLELSRRVRAGEHARGIARGLPIIAITGSVEPHQREQCLAAGMDDMLSKPCPLALLRETLERWIDGPASRAARPISVAPDTVPATGVEFEEAQTLDPRALAEIRTVERMTGTPLLRRAIESFVRTAPAMIVAIRDGLSSGDSEKLRTTAHTLKSPSAQLGALPLSKACADLEALARSGDLADATALVAAIDREFERALRALEHEASRK